MIGGHRWFLPAARWVAPARDRPSGGTGTFPYPVLRHAQRPCAPFFRKPRHSLAAEHTGGTPAKNDGHNRFSKYPRGRLPHSRGALSYGHFGHFAGRAFPRANFQGGPMPAPEQMICISPSV